MNFKLDNGKTVFLSLQENEDNTISLMIDQYHVIEFRPDGAMRRVCYVGEETGLRLTAVEHRIEEVENNYEKE